MVACQTKPENKPTVDTIVTADTVVVPAIKITKLNAMPISLVVVQQEAPIYDKIEADRQIIDRLYRGDSVIFTNQLAAIEEPIVLQSIRYQEPWLSVILENNEKGWIPAAYVSFDGAAQPELREKVLLQRAANFFGANIAQQLGIYTKEAADIQTLPAFRLLYTRANNLADSISHRLNNWVKTNPQQLEDLPNFYWINELTEGMLLHYLEEKQEYQLYKDLRIWQSWTAQTAATQDEQFVEVLLAAYAQDSIEYDFYDWEFPVDRGVMASMLGSNTHHQVLQKMQAVQDSANYFAPELTKIKQDLINNISLSNQYWLSLESALIELDSILQYDQKVLTKIDKSELTTRKQLLQNPTENKITGNLFESYRQEEEVQ